MWAKPNKRAGKDLEKPVARKSKKSVVKKDCQACCESKAGEDAKNVVAEILPSEPAIKSRLNVVDAVAKLHQGPA